MTNLGWARNPSIAILAGIVGLLFVGLREWFKSVRWFIRVTNLLFLIVMVAFTYTSATNILSSLKEPATKPKNV